MLSKIRRILIQSLLVWNWLNQFHGYPLSFLAEPRFINVLKIIGEA
jgi:hypothetical protein